MRLFLFGASVFYLLGLKLTSQIEIKSPFTQKQEIIESKTLPETKKNSHLLESKPESTKKDTTISTERECGKVSTPDAKALKKQSAFPTTAKQAV